MDILYPVAAGNWFDAQKIRCDLSLLILKSFTQTMLKALKHLVFFIFYLLRLLYYFIILWILTGMNATTIPEW